MSGRYKQMPELENFTPSGGASDKDIETFEDEIGFRMPEDYREFLAQYGSALWFGGHILGIGEGQFPSMLNLDSRSHVTSARARPALAHEKMVCPVARYDAGGYYVMTDAGVALIDDETPDKIAERWDSFSRFLQQSGIIPHTNSEQDGVE